MCKLSAKEINQVAQLIHSMNGVATGYPDSFLDLAESTILHLRKTAYVYLTGDFELLHFLDINY